MAGNTRGKLKEHFEGIHRNLDWSVRHVNQSLILIHQSLSFTEDYVKLQGNEQAIENLLNNNAMYQAVKGIGEGIKVLDDLAQQIYLSF